MPPTSRKRRLRRHLLSVLQAALAVQIESAPVIAFSASSSGGGSGPDRGTDPPPSPLPYLSRSTATPDQSSSFAAGSAARRGRLDSALADLGVDPPPDSNPANSDPAGHGAAADGGCDVGWPTSALRMYSSYVLPKSAGALATAELPQRASVIANSISFQIREYRSHMESWVRNHDRSLGEAEELFRTTNSRSSTATAAGGGAPPSLRNPLTIILDNVRSAHNVGNILRLSEAARVTSVILCGITPSPPNPKVLKTAVGAAAYVPHSHRGSTLETIRELQQSGVAVWGVETTERSKVVWRADMPRPLALVFGNELVGVDADVLAECDELICLPTHGVKNSLNVATCASVVVWEALRQWEDDDG